VTVTTDAPATTDTPDLDATLAKRLRAMLPDEGRGAHNPDSTLGKASAAWEWDTKTLASDAENRVVPGDPLTTWSRVPKLSVSRSEPPAPADADLKVIRELGRGGMGVVEAALQSTLQREVAVKTAREARTEDRHALLREARIAGGLEHPNIVPIHMLGRDADGSPMVVMKRVRGQPWTEVVDAGSSTDDILEVFSEVCHALAFAHDRGVIHLDVKPDNVMLGEFGEVILLDWGIARRVGETDVPKSRTGIVGTPAFMAPEMAEGRLADLNERSDVFLLGATLFRAFEGKPPYHGRNLFAVVARACNGERGDYEHTPPGIRPILDKAMAVDPEHRFASVGELSEAVRAFARRQPVEKLLDGSTRVIAELERTVDGLMEEASASSSSAQRGSRREIREECGQARFVAQQVLEEWPDDVSATELWRRSTIVLVRLALAYGDLGVARAVLEELKDPPADLVSEVEALKAEEAARRAELAERRRAMDMESGRANRRRLGIAVLFSVFLIEGIGFAVFGTAVPSHKAIIIPAVSVLMLLSLGAWFTRAQWRHTFADALMVRALLGWLVYQVLHRCFATYLGTPVPAIMLADLWSLMVPVIIVQPFFKVAPWVIAYIAVMTSIASTLDIVHLMFGATALGAAGALLIENMERRETDEHESSDDTG